MAAFVADILDSGAEPATARSRHLALRRYSAWLVEERELRDDPLLGSKPPKLDAKVVPVLTDEQLRALVKACDGPDLRDRRDESVVRLMAETGMRAGEVIGMTGSDVDLPHGLAALDRYLRLRRAHRLAESAPLWLGAPRQGRHLLRTARRAEVPRRARRHCGLPPARAAAHRGLALARRRRHRGRADGGGRLVAPGHDRPLYQGHRRAARR